MPKIQLHGKAAAAVAHALESYAEEMFREQGGEWTAVIRLAHQGRSEELKTQDEVDFLERRVKLRAVDAEIVTGPHLKAAEDAMQAARYQRETAGTLLDDAFRSNDRD